MGELLKNYYNSDVMVKSLLQLGNINYLGEYLAIPADKFPRKELYLPNIDCMAHVETGGDGVEYPYNVQIWHKNARDDAYIYAGDGAFLPCYAKIKEFLIARNENQSTQEIDDYLEELKKYFNSTVTEAYHRDYDEDLHYYSFGSEEEFLNKTNSVEFKYLWKNGEWLYVKGEDNRHWKSL